MRLNVPLSPYTILRTHKIAWRKLCSLFLNIVNPIQDGVEGVVKRSPPTSFFPVTSTNVGFGPQNFLTFSFNPFATLLQNFKFVPSASPKLLNLNQDHL